MPESFASIVRVAVALCCLVLCSRCDSQTWTADNGNGTYSNPLFFDEFSDPDMIRVGSDFYLTGTTMHSMPGLPILHSRDLVNWDFQGYALDKLDLGPAFHLQDGKNIYGQGIWAPCFRYRNGTFYIFSNVNGQTTQLFRATDPKGPWTRTAMKRSLHDLSVLFDDDGKAWVVWGYQSIHIAQLTPDLTDIVRATERELIRPEQGMGEGLHFYKFQGKYFITSAWYMDVMRMPVARASQLSGPWEVNQEISKGEDFGWGKGYRLQRNSKPGQFQVTPPDPDAVGVTAIHQGGIVDTATGQWWGFSMKDANSVGRLVNLSPVTWADGWPYFGLPGNLGRSPRTWIKPDTGATSAAHAPYERNDNFRESRLKPIWQWNHIPVEDHWSLIEHPGALRLHALPAEDLWQARNTLTQRAIGPRSQPTVALDASHLEPGDVAGLALFNWPYAWIGVEKSASGIAVTQYESQYESKIGTSVRELLNTARIWLRADCDFLSEQAQLSYSTDGKQFKALGKPFTMIFQTTTFQGVRYALFNYHTGTSQTAGYADFSDYRVKEFATSGLSKPIPYGKAIQLIPLGGEAGQRLASSAHSLFASPKLSAAFTVVDRGLGRVALQAPEGFISVDQSGSVSLRSCAPGDAETFQWIETITGELTLLSVETHRYLRVDAENNRILADSPGPRPDGKDGVRFAWKPI